MQQSSRHWPIQWSVPGLLILGNIFPREQQTPEALAAFHKAEIEKRWPIIKAANIKPQ